MCSKICIRWEPTVWKQCTVTQSYLQTDLVLHNPTDSFTHTLHVWQTCGKHTCCLWKKKEEKKKRCVLSVKKGEKKEEMQIAGYLSHGTCEWSSQRWSFTLWDGHSHNNECFNKSSSVFLDHLISIDQTNIVFVKLRNFLAQIYFEWFTHWIRTSDKPHPPFFVFVFCKWKMQLF